MIGMRVIFPDGQRSDEKFTDQEWESIEIFLKACQDGDVVNFKRFDGPGARKALKFKGFQVACESGHVEIIQLYLKDNHFYFDSTHFFDKYLNYADLNTSCATACKTIIDATGFNCYDLRKLLFKAIKSYNNSTEVINHLLVKMQPEDIARVMAEA